MDNSDVMFMRINYIYVIIIYAQTNAQTDLQAGNVP